MAEVTESAPASPVRPIRKDQGRFVRKRPGRGEPPAEEGDESGASGQRDGEGIAHPTEHIDTYA